MGGVALFDDDDNKLNLGNDHFSMEEATCPKPTVASSNGTNGILSAMGNPAWSNASM
jgi:hypothetical protein